MKKATIALLLICTAVFAQQKGKSGTLEGVKGTSPKEEAAPPPAQDKAPAAPANSPSKAIYCVSYVTGTLVSCIELKDTHDVKKICGIQNNGMKMMLGEAKLTETRPNIECTVLP